MYAAKTVKKMAAGSQREPAAATGGPGMPADTITAGGPCYGRRPFWAAEMTSISPSTSTKDAEYAERLTRHSGVWWKRLLDVQRPYRMHLQAMKLGFVLDI